MWRLALGPLVLLWGCLGPLVSDAPSAETGSLILPHGSEVPSLYSDPALAAQVDQLDGVGDFIPLMSGFADGEAVRYWDFGAAPDTVAPVYVVGELANDGSFVRADHPSIFDVVPGDPGYTPFWQMVLVPTTEAYRGEQLTSVLAIQEARAKGLVKSFVPTDVNVNCPVVAEGVLLEVGGGQPPVVPHVAYYRGLTVDYHTLSPPLPLDAMAVRYPVADVYALRREGGEPLSESARGVDMTGDGDLVDSNNVFEVGLGSASYTPLWRVVEVVVPAGTTSIDDSGDQTVAQLTDASDLFELAGDALVPVAGNVVAFHPTELLVNCPIQLTEGEP